MKKAGFRLALLGLLVGILLGGLVRLEGYAARELMGALGDELQSSVPCSLEYDSATISFLALRGEARNARVMCSGETKLRFDRIEADFSIRNITSRRVEITELRLIGGHAEGVGVDSATYKFIDYLSAPIPPERDRPDRWKIQLLTLKLLESSFVEEFTTSKLLATNVGMTMRRDENDDVVLAPTIESLVLRLSSGKDRSRFTDLALGKVSGDILLRGETTDFRSIHVALGNVLSNLKGTALKRSGNTLTGESDHFITLSYLGLPEWLAIPLGAKGEVTGTLESPIVTGRFESPDDMPGRITPGGREIVRLDSVEGAFSVDANHRHPIVRIPELSGQGDGASLSLATPLLIKDDKISGRVHLNVETIDISPARFEDVDVDITLSGDIDDVKTSFAGSVGRASLFDAVVRGWSLVASVEDDVATLEATHSGPSGARGTVAGTISLKEKEPVMEEMRFDFKDISATSLFTDSTSRALLVSSSGVVSGPFDPKLIKSAGSVVFSGEQFPERAIVDTKFSIEKGELLLSGASRDGTITTNLSLPIDGRDKEGVLKVAGTRVPGEGYVPALVCSDIDLSLDYRIGKTGILRGNGTLALPRVAVGCEPYVLRNNTPISIRVADGELALPDFSLTGEENRLSLGGKVSLTGVMNIKAKGEVPLATFTGFVPTLDDLRGTIMASVSLTGPLPAPVIIGDASIKDGEFSAESLGILAESVSGKLSLKGRTVQVDSLTGTLNGGKASLGGSIILDQVERSTITLNFNDILFQPDSNMSVSLGGDLSIGTTTSGDPSVRGTVEIEGGEFQKNIDFLSLIRSLTRILFAAREAKSELATLPRVGLDLSVIAKRNLFVVTSLLGAELKADLHVGGNLASPVISGAMETLSGWFGLKDRRFDITSGVISFAPGTLEPTLDLVGESTIRSRSADNINVIVTATGPLTSPRIELASDSGLTQREILSLVTAGSSARQQTQINEISRGVETNYAYSPLQDIPIFNYSSFFTSLTRIDSLSIEPRYSIQSGAVEPVVVARKRLFESVSLLGESYLGGTVNESRVGVIYDLTDRFNILGYSSTAASGEAVALGVDATYTILASQKKFIEIIPEGMKRIRSQEVLRVLKLSAASRIDPSDLDSLKERILKLYRSRGYFRANVEVSCESDDGYCRKLWIKVREGNYTVVNSLRLEGDDVSMIRGFERAPAIDSNTPASQQFGREQRDQLVRALRSEGFIGARVSAAYRHTEEKGRSDLVLTVKAGKPVTFSFSGNTVFTPEQFLDTINLFKRKLPFGNNTINILLKNIDQKYREAGYLYSAISYTEKMDDTTNRVNYLVQIDEGTRTVVDDVIFEGNVSLSKEELIALSTPNGEKVVTSLFHPKYAVAEEIERNISLLTSLYDQEGYPEAKISSKLDLSDDSSRVVIRYLIDEGTGVSFTGTHVSGFPPGLDLPDLPAGTLSAPRANEYVALLTATLRDGGFLAPALYTSRAPDSGSIEIEIIPGEQTLIGKVALEGLVEIPENVLRDALSLKEGTPWNSRAIIENRRRILRLGLFSRIEMVPADGILDSSNEDLLIRVTERALRTLDIGGGVNSEYGLHVFGEATDRALFADGRSLSLRLDTFFDSAQGSGISKGIASAKYSDPSFLGSNYSLTEDLRYQKLERSNQEYDLDRTSLASYLYRSWEDAVSLTAGYTILDENLSNVSEGAIRGEYDSGNVRLGFLSTSLTYDQRDNPLNPSRGYIGSFDYQIADSAILSDASFQSIGLRLATLFPLSHRFTFAFNTRGEFSDTLGDTDVVPISQRYYLGGRNSVRGFKENSLGPRGSDNAIIGGDVLFSNNLELQYRTSDATSLVLFVDAGNVFLREIGYDGLRYSTGVGFRYLSPIGPIGFDIGHPLERDDGESAYRLHFNIGTNF